MSETDVNGRSTKYDACPKCEGRVTTVYPKGTWPQIADHCSDCGWRSELHDGGADYDTF